MRSRTAVSKSMPVKPMAASPHTLTHTLAEAQEQLAAAEETWLALATELEEG